MATNDQPQDAESNLLPGRIPRTNCPAGCEWTFITRTGMNNHLKNKHPEWQPADQVPDEAKLEVQMYCFDYSHSDLGCDYFKCTGPNPEYPDEAKVPDDDIFTDQGCDTNHFDDLRRQLDLAGGFAYQAGRESMDGEVAQANAFYEASAEEARVALHEVAQLRGEKADMQREWHDEMTTNVRLQAQVKELVEAGNCLGNLMESTPKERKNSKINWIKVRDGILIKENHG